MALVWPKVLLVTLVTQFSLYFNDLYRLRVTESTVDLATRLLQSVGMTSIALAVIYFLWPDAIIGRWVFFLSLLFLVGFLVSWRLLHNVIISRHMFANNVMLVGAGLLARDLLSAVSERKGLGYQFHGIFAHSSESSALGDLEGIPLHRGFESLCELAEDQEVAGIIVALDEKRGIMPYRELLRCKIRGLSVIDGESFYEQITGTLLVDKINPSWLIFSDGFRKLSLTRFFKRVVDLVMSVLMLIALFPLMAFVAAAIRVDSAGPAIFSQKRVGDNGREFMLHKFRSMRENAEAETGPVWASENDSRVTRLGLIIRKLRIDELPQLWNVIRGEMSFVGPRPERPFFVEKLGKTIPYYNERHSVKPGVTGWAQVKYPYGDSEEGALEKLKYDLYYIKNMSLVLDFVVIFHTVKIVLLGRGAQ